MGSESGGLAESWAQSNPSFTHDRFETLGKFLSVSGPQFTYLQNEHNTSANFIELYEDQTHLQSV